MTVLLVEDDEGVRELLQRVLQRHGHEVLLAANGEEAEAAARGGRPDVLVCDMCLPGLSGVELTRRIRASHPGLPVLVVSGDPNQDLPVDGDGPARFLGKPFTTADFLAHVRDLSGAVDDPSTRTD